MNMLDYYFTLVATSNLCTYSQEEHEKGTGQERRPFNRETDLEIRSSLVTPAKRKALMKDSRSALDTKFTHGSRSFL